ncbi:DUF885 family protein [Sphingomonas carotinifaciens]|uniref:DUF885 family protein n=1 Tax=Sphingomonas carotinifaciens TaxID=1166323 RepID=UPI000DD69554|nr:DUF885 family protein [Sphingomonas carotinifaciens]
MTCWSRRAVLGGAIALAASPIRAQASRGQGIRPALDRAATLPPADALALLAPLEATTPRDRLDLDTARAGLAAEIRLAATPSYLWHLRRIIGDTVTPATARDRLTHEHTRLLARADRLFDALGDRSGSVGERYRRLWTDERFLYPDSEAGRNGAIADMRATLDRCRAHIAPIIGPVPPWCLDVHPARMTAAEDAAGKGGYRTLPRPGLSGAYVVDLRAIRRRPAWSLPSVVAHELLPGHMIQLPLEVAADPHPLRLRYASGFAEGWATYAEALAWNAGWLGADPRVELGHVHWLLFRTARALADLALHDRHVAPDVMAARMAEWLGEPVAFIGFDADLARITREPATRVAEALAWLALVDAAPPAGLPTFHHRMLIDGRRRSDRIAVTSPS